MKTLRFFIALIILKALPTTAGSVEVPFNGYDSWLKSQPESRIMKRTDDLKKKASIVHAIDRRELKENIERNYLGRSSFEVASQIIEISRSEEGELVEAVLKKDQVHYYYYKTDNPASVKATLAWQEGARSNLNIRIIGSHGAIRPWSQSTDGKITRSQKETNSTVERVDTEVKKNDEIIIKVSSPDKSVESEKYVLLVSGCTFSERQKNSASYLEFLKVEDSKKQDRVKDYIKETGAALDSILPNGQKWHMVDVINGKPKYVSTFNLNAAKSAGVDKIWPQGGLGLNLSGGGLERSLGIWDEGAVRTTHQEVTGRVTLGDNVSPAEHSSHVGGTMIATGVQKNAKGMAFEAKLKSYDWNNDVSEMGSEASNGLIVSQHSYGMPQDYSYSRTWDQLANQYPMYTISKSAANDGKFRTVTRDGNCKNIITVGSALDQPNGWQGASSNSAVLSSFSSKGPAPDGRIKPDILSNGQDVYSMQHNGDAQYTSMSGTSMAGPAHAGAISLLQEHYYNTHNEAYMDAATLKALVIHSADEIDAAGPDFSSGWGYLNVKTAAEIITTDDGGSNEIIQTQTLENNGDFVYPAVHISGEDIIVTIVWNDPAPGSNSGNALVNDLDLRVFVDGTEHKPWMMPWTGSNHDVKAQRGDNDLDNVEKVQISNPSGSSVEIVVNHKGSLQGGSQKFSLVMSGVMGNRDPFVKVNSPKGGEEWEVYSPQKIKWSSNVDSPVDILLLKGSSVVDTLAKTATNSGLLEWLIPETLSVGSDYKIKIICVDTTDIFGESEESFSIIAEELIAEFPFEEPFETYENESYDIGKWEQDKDNDDIDWLVYTGVTPTGQFGVDAGTGPGTGPLGDHTSGSGKYVYVESSYNYEDNKTSIITSPKFDLRGVANPKLKYWLQMYAVDGNMGTLNVDVALEGNWTEGVKTYSGSQGEDWFTDSIDLSPFIGKRVQFRFRGAVGDSFYSDICLDDIGLSAISLPDFKTISNANAKEGVEFSKDISIDDGSVSGLTFEIENGPNWLSISTQNSSGCTVSGVPAEGDAGIETIAVKLKVGDAYRTAEFDIDIKENSKPHFTSDPINEAEAGDEYLYQITLEDSDSENELTISGDNLPSWLDITDNGDGTALLKGTPEPENKGDHDITILGDDNVVSEPAKQEFKLKVKDDVGIFTDGKVKVKDQGLQAVPSVIANSQTEFYLKSKKYSTYVLYIYDNAQNLIKSQSGTFREMGINSNLSYCGKWDGYNSGGRMCASGTYVILLKAEKFDGTIDWYRTLLGIEE